MLIAALLAPFVSLECPGCPPALQPFPGAALRSSPDAWALIWIIGIVVAAAVLFVAGVAARQMAVVSAVTSVVAIGLAVFEGAVAHPRILDIGELEPGVPVGYVLGPGYYLALI